MDRFIARENIRHLRGRLASESDTGVRARLARLLVEEEDKLAADLELLADVDRHIGDGRLRIDRQRALVATLERDGHAGLGHARILLYAMLDSEALHTTYRERILIKIERGRL